MKLQRIFSELNKALVVLGFVLLCLPLSNLKAQEVDNVIKGVVLSQEGIPLTGATVYVKGVPHEVSTNFNGEFEIKSKNTNPVLVISLLGFQKKEIPVKGGNSLKIILKEDVNFINEVVITALGIKREQKKLAYSQKKVKEEELSQAMPNNWSSGLKGKVAGLNIVSASSGPINSQKIQLRGNNSLNPQENNALIVVDGVPINSTMTASGSSTAYMGGDSPVDYGNGISSLNVLNIESVTVLRGPAATALYGSRAANGVLIITTKSGKDSEGLGITYNTSIAFDVIQRWPDYQYKYGQGTGNALDENGIPYYSYGDSEDGPNTGSTSSAWGPKFDGQYFYQYDPRTEGQSLERQLWQPYIGNRKDFWRTGITVKNNISLQGSSKKGSMRMSVGHTNNEWIMPNTGYEKTSASINASYQISKKVKLQAIVNYNNQTSDNLPSTGYNNGSIAYFMIFQNPNIDLDWYRDIWVKGKKDIQQIQPFSSYVDNPFLIAYEALNSFDSNQLIGTVNVNVELTKNLDLRLRSSLYTYNNEREQQRPYSINRHAKGFFKTQDIYKKEMNSDFLLSYSDTFNDDFDFDFSVGGNAMQYEYRRIDLSVDGLVVPGVYKLSNGINNPVVVTRNRNKRVNSLYGLISLSYKDKLFLDLTGRNDWSSTLPAQHNSFFYPSAGISAILSKIFRLPKAFDYLKFRFSFAQVGNDTDPYKTSKYYSQSSFPSSAVAPLTLFNANFKPEISTSFESGIDLRMFKNLINLDATVYQSTTKNQILSVPLDITTGYSRAILNSGEVRNRGIELSFTGNFVDKENFSWSTSLNWSRNWNKVLSLAEGIEGQQEIGSAGSASIIAKVGGTTTAIYGAAFVRSPNGEIVYDEAGLPAYPDDISYIGDASPDWKAGWANNFTFGHFWLNILIDGQYGGIIYSQTHHKLMQQGKLKSTFYGREEGYIIGDGVVLNADGTYSPNTTKVKTPAWYNRYYRRANVESNSFDASYIKLREVSLGFNFPEKWLEGSRILGVSASLYASNIAMISDFPIYDPETAALNGDTILPGMEIGQMPSPATYGFNLKIKF